MHRQHARVPTSSHLCDRGTREADSSAHMAVTVRAESWGRGGAGMGGQDVIKDVITSLESTEEPAIDVSFRGRAIGGTPIETWEMG